MAAATLVGAALPRAPWQPRSALLRDGLVVLGFSAFVALSAQVSLALPFTPVPVTGQTLAVLLAAAALGSRLGMLTMLAYVSEGLAGLPVFAGGANAWAPSRLPGVPYILGPTLGYLAGFVAAAAVVGWLAERGWDRTPLRAAGAMLAGQAAIYLLGLAWLARFVPLEAVAAAGLLPFLPGDALKLALASAALPGAWALLGRRPQG